MWRWAIKKSMNLDLRRTSVMSDGSRVRQNPPVDICWILNSTSSCVMRSRAPVVRCQWFLASMWPAVWSERSMTGWAQSAVGCDILMGWIRVMLLFYDKLDACRFLLLDRFWSVFATASNPQSKPDICGLGSFCISGTFDVHLHQPCHGGEKRPCVLGQETSRDGVRRSFGCCSLPTYIYIYNIYVCLTPH